MTLPRDPARDVEKESVEDVKLDQAHDDLLDDPDAHLSEAEKKAIDKKLVRKLDIRLIPWLCLLYLAAFLDRTNIGNAKILGLEDDVHLTNGTYNASLSIFFVSYSVFEPATNVLLKRFRPSVFLSISMTLWGLSMVGMGFVKNHSGLYAARWFLGICEAGLFPGVNYLLSAWYKRSEFGIRAAIFFSAAALAGSFGGLLAAAIDNMNGIRGLEGWRWIFIIEGIGTVLLGMVSYWMVHDFPDEATFLTDEERRRVIRRLKIDGQSSAEHEAWKMTYFWNSMRDWKTYAYAAVYMGADMPLYAFSLFIPTIIKELNPNVSSIHANLLTVPPYAAAAVVTVTVGWFADRTGKRGWCNIGTSIFGVIGFAMLIGASQPGVKYAGVFLAAAGIYPCIPNTISWAANNVEGVYKRGVTLGFLIGWGNLNGIVSSNIYQANTSPNFRTGHGIVLAYLFLFLFCGSIAVHFALERENKKRRAGARDHTKEGKSRQEIALMGDLKPDFMYVT